MSVSLHPSTVAVVSCSPDRLAALAELLPSKPPHWRYRYYSDPEQALRDINTQKPPPVPLRQYAASPDGERLQLDLRHVHRDIYRAERLQEVAVAVVDADMPVGYLEWCDQIRGPFVQRLAVGKDQQEEDVIHALDTGRLTQFVYANWNEAAQRLREMLQHAVERYCAAASASVKRVLTEAIPDTSVLDPFFIDFFQEKCQELKVAEYYPYGPELVFVLIDVYGKRYALFAKTPDQLESDRHRVQADPLPDDVKHLLEKRARMLCYPVNGDHDVPDSSEWGIYLQEPKELWGRRNYYAATRRDPFALDEDKDVEFFDPYTQLSPRDAVKESSPSVDGT
ncbi:MAG: hypothetical protein AAF471_09550, partial [Myxococcota bacterium]